ncbi:MAG: hypothetical protein ACE5GE_07425 [Phycisphaerae bacterium]
MERRPLFEDPIRYRWLVPEIERLESKAARQEAWKAALRPTSLRRILCMVGTVTGSAALALVLGSILGRLPVLNQFGWIQAGWHNGLLAGMMSGASCGALLWFFRRGIRRALRVHMRETGFMICLSCGYDLGGNESGVCPECGKKTPRD